MYSGADAIDPQAARSKQPGLPQVTEKLAFGDVALRLEEIVPGDPSYRLVPYYHFRIIASGGRDVGHINLRVGATDHVLLCAGHIGFQIREEFRGHGYALQACRALGPFVRSIYRSVTITCDPENIASMRTIEKLGAMFVDEIAVPLHDPQHQQGSRRKRRYNWSP